MNKKKPLEKQFPSIDNIFWELLESDCYIDIPETSGTIEKVNEDEEALLQALRDRKVSDEIIKKVGFDLSTVSTCAGLYGEEKGFILGYIHGAKMATDLANGYNLLQLNPDSLKQKQDE